MPATKIQANWTGVAHGANSVTKVTNVSFDMGGQNQSFSADTDRFPTLVANLMNNPTAVVTTADVGTAFGSAFSPGTGTAGGTTLNATLKDAANQAGGDVVFALANAVVSNVSGSGAHAQFASATINFQAFSSDGQTSPLSITRA